MLREPATGAVPVYAFLLLHVQFVHRHLHRALQVHLDPAQHLKIKPRTYGTSPPRASWRRSYCTSCCLACDDYRIDVS